MFQTQNKYNQGDIKMPISSNMTHSEIVEELMRTYNETGKIGDYKPKSKKEAREMANAIAFRIKEGK